MENKWIILQLLFLCYQNVFSTGPQYENSHNPSRSKRENKNSCDDEWFPYGDMCYWVSKKGRDGKDTWREAEEKCQGYGGHLAIIHSAKLNDFLSKLLYTLGEEVWLGLHGRDSKDLVWVDGSPLDYSKWKPNEPTRFSGSVKEDCVRMSEGSGKWNDITCTWTSYSICQKTKVATNTPEVEMETPVVPDSTNPSDRHILNFNLHTSFF